MQYADLDAHFRVRALTRSSGHHLVLQVPPLMLLKSMRPSAQKFEVIEIRGKFAMRTIEHYRQEYNAAASSIDSLPWVF